MLFQNRNINDDGIVSVIPADHVRLQAFQRAGGNPQTVIVYRYSVKNFYFS